MALLRHNHRDICQRVIVDGDYLLWGNKNQGYGLTMVRCIGATSQYVRIIVIETNYETLVKPENLMVVTQQLQSNLDGNVGANA